ncbi:MAG: phage portal protein [Haliangiales bacterium]
MTLRTANTRLRVRVRAGSQPVRIAGAPTAYGAADRVASEVSAWAPRTGSAEALLRHEREEIRGRARDLVRNSGYAAGAVRRETDAVVGATLRPVPRLDAAALGIEPAEAVRLKREIIAAWRSWAEDPRHIADASRQQSLSGLFALAYRHYIVDGDALGVLHWDPSGTWATRLRVVDPDLLSTPDDRVESARLMAGVETDRHGAPVAYHIRRAPDDLMVPDPDAWTWDRVPAETPWGRPVVVHFFDRERDGQRRGVSRFASVVEALKMQDRYARSELQAAVLNAVFGLFITSPYDESIFDTIMSAGAGEISEYQSARKAFHGKEPITLDGVRVNRLFPGESIESTGARQVNQFADFEAAVLRRVAAGLGMSYEQLSNDWTKTNYSSARASLLEIWRGWTRARRSFVDGFCAPVYMAFLEEAADTGRVRLPAGAPSIMEAPGLWCRARWIGPGRGFVDPVKEAQAAQMRIALGLSTATGEAAELTGDDYDETRAELREEIAATPAGVLHPATADWVDAFGALPGRRDGQDTDG